MNASIELSPLVQDSPPRLVLDFDPLKQRRGRPSLHCPLAPELNVHVLHAHEHTREWIVRHELVRPGEPAFEQWCAGRFSRLAARAYPTLSRNELELVSDWVSFLFFYDDLCDTRKVDEPAYRDWLGELEQRIVATGAGEVPQATDHRLVHALADIRDRLAVYAATRWLDRFSHHLEEYIEGVRWERALRLHGAVPNVGTYSRLRLLNSAVFPCLDVAGIFVDGTDTSFVEDVYMRQLEVMANDHISWVNDIYGVDKEIREHTTANLVVVLMHERGLPWDTALDLAIRRCNAELEAFASLRNLVLDRCDERGRAYIRALEAWMRGNIDWYAETRRYQSLTESLSS